jgi:hypothetical protein
MSLERRHKPGVRRSTPDCDTAQQLPVLAAWLVLRCNDDEAETGGAMGPNDSQGVSILLSLRIFESRTGRQGYAPNTSAVKQAYARAE